MAENILDGLFNGYQRRAPQVPGAFPSHLLDAPGLLGGLVDYTITAAPKPQPILALGSALVILGCLFGRRVRLANGVWTNVLAIGLGETGCGKEFTREAGRRLLRAIGMEAMAAHDNVTSDAAINHMLLRHPSAALALDEFGLAMREFQERNAGVLRSIMEISGKANGVHHGKVYARDRKTGRDVSDAPLPNPCLCIWATSVPDRFWSALTNQSALDGFLNRFLLFVSETPNPEDAGHESDAGPSLTLIAQAQRWAPDLAAHAAAGAALNGLPQKPDALVAAVTAEARRELKTFTARVHAMRSELHGCGETIRFSLLARIHETAQRLALVRAAGQGTPSHVVVEAHDAQWACELAAWCAESMAREAEKRIGDTELDRDTKAVLAWIGQRGVAKHNDFTRAFWRLPTKQRAEILRTLMDSHLVVEVKARTAGRPAVAYRLAEVIS